MRIYEKIVIECVVLGLRDAGMIDDRAIDCIAKRLQACAPHVAEYGSGEAVGMEELAEQLKKSI